MSLDYVEYVGRRHADGVRVMVYTAGRGERPLVHHVLHSPTGFAWGYVGSGPADLALSMLADALAIPALPADFFQRATVAELAAAPRAALAWHLHQDFMREVVATLPRGEWMLTHDAVRRWIARTVGPVFKDTPVSDSIAAAERLRQHGADLAVVAHTRLDGPWDEAAHLRARAALDRLGRALGPVQQTLEALDREAAAALAALNPLMPAQEDAPDDGPDSGRDRP
ncbi:MAG: hypothetical protein K6V97_11310 [Actinomycetia bacterium]|nr:hypothetical protein [Actinomycetes bacterium]